MVKYDQWSRNHLQKADADVVPPDARVSETEQHTVRYWSVRVWYSRVSPRERLPRIKLPIDQSRAEHEVQVAGERRVSLRFTCDTRAQTIPEYMYSSRTVGGVISVTLLRCVSENRCCAFTDERVALHHESDLWRKRRSLNEWMNDDDVYSALLCIAVHPERFTIMGGGGVSLNTRSEESRSNDRLHPCVCRLSVKACLTSDPWPLTPVWAHLSFTVFWDDMQPVISDLFHLAKDGGLWSVNPKQTNLEQSHKNRIHYPFIY